MKSKRRSSERLLSLSCLPRYSYQTQRRQNRRPLITGALFHQHEGEERVVATDGRRMAMITLPLTNKPAVAETSIPMRAMPYAACMKMIDLIESLNPNVCRLRFTENAMGFEAEGVSLRCLLPKGDFADYKEGP